MGLGVIGVTFAVGWLVGFIGGHSAGSCYTYKQLFDIFSKEAFKNEDTDKSNYN